MIESELDVLRDVSELHYWTRDPKQCRAPHYYPLLKSELQLRDARNLLEPESDFSYLSTRAESLGVKLLRTIYSTPMNDTDPKIAELVRRRLLERPGAERILMGSQMFCLAKAMVLASFPEGLSEIEIKRRLCQRFYGNEVDVEAFVQHLHFLSGTTPESPESAAKCPN